MINVVCKYRVSEWLFFNANSANFQLYHGENKLVCKYKWLVKISTFIAADFFKAIITYKGTCSKFMSSYVLTNKIMSVFAYFCLYCVICWWHCFIGRLGFLSSWLFCCFWYNLVRINVIFSVFRLETCHTHF